MQWTNEDEPEALNALGRICADPSKPCAASKSALPYQIDALKRDRSKVRSLGVR